MTSNKKVLIGASAGLIVAAIVAAIFFLYPYFQKTDLLKYVPKNSIYVMKVDLMRIGKKIDFNQLSEMRFFKKEVKKELSGSQKDLMDKLMKDPLQSGLQLRTSPVLFIYNNSEKNAEPVVGILMGISDDKKFYEFLRTVEKGIKIKDPDEEGYYQLKSEDDPITLYFNKNVALFLGDINEKDLSLRSIRDKILTTQKEKSILANDEFVSISKNENDMLLYLSQSEVEHFVELQGGTGESASDKKKGENFIRSLPAAVTVNFNEDSVLIRSYGSKKSGGAANSFFKENGLSESDMSNMHSGGDPLAYATLNLDPKKTLALITEFSELSGDRGSAEFFEGVDQLANEAGMQKEELLNLFNGKFSVSFTGIEEKTRLDEYTMEEVKEPVPIFNFWAQVTNRENMDKILQLLLNGGSIIENEGYYALSDGGSSGITFGMKGNNFFLSTSRTAVSEKLSNDSWRPLKDSKGKGVVSSRPFVLYADLRYKSIEGILKKYMDSKEIIKLESKLKNILSYFETLRMYSSNDESEFVFAFSKKNINSLQRIFMLVDEVYQLEE